MKKLHKILGMLVAAVVQVILSAWFYEWLKRMTGGLGSLWRTVSKTGRKHWAEYVVPAAHVLAIATLVVGGFRIHWIQGVATVATAALIYGYEYWPQIRKYSLAGYSRVMRWFGKTVTIKIPASEGGGVEAQFRVLA